MSIVYCVKLPNQKKVVKGINLEAVDSCPLPIEAVVETKDLATADENGKVGHVVGFDTTTDCVCVQLFDENCKLKVKPDKLEQIPDAD